MAELVKRDPPPPETITLDEDEMITVGPALILAIAVMEVLLMDKRCRRPADIGIALASPELAAAGDEIKAGEIAALEKIVARLDLGEMNIRQFEAEAGQSIEMLACRDHAPPSDADMDAMVEQVALHRPERAAKIRAALDRQRREAGKA